MPSPPPFDLGKMWSTWIKLRSDGSFRRQIPQYPCCMRISSRSLDRGEGSLRITTGYASAPMMRRTRACSTSTHPLHWQSHPQVSGSLLSACVSTEPHIEHQMGGVFGALSSGGCFTGYASALQPRLPLPLQQARLSRASGYPSRASGILGTTRAWRGSLDTTCGRTGDMRPWKL